MDMDLKHIHPNDVTPDGVRLPRFVVRIAQTKSPARDYDYLSSNFSEWMSYAANDELIPLSDIEALPEPFEDLPGAISHQHAVAVLREIASILDHTLN